MGHITFYYSPLSRLINYTRLQRAGSYSAMLKEGRYDPSSGVTILGAMHPDDDKAVNEWIINNFRRLDKWEQRSSVYRKLVLDAWDVRDPTMLYRNWDWLTAKERRARRTAYLVWRRVERPTLGDHARKMFLKATKRIVIG